MKVPLLSPPEAKRYTQYLHSRYGIPFAVMKDWQCAAHQKSVFVLSPENKPLLHEKAVNVFSVGVLAFTDGISFQPTSNFITLLGRHITQNIFEVPETKLDSFFARKNMKREECAPTHVLSDGWVAISVRGKIIASASVKGNHLIPNLPGEIHGRGEE